MASNNRWSAIMPPVTKNLIIINAIMWVATILLKQRGLVELDKILGLHFWQASDFKIYQFFTYMFMHDSSGFSTGIAHIFFNMFSLWMFGMLLERVMGAKRYLFFYISCGLGAALVQEVVWQLSYMSTPCSNDGGVTVYTIEELMRQGHSFSEFGDIINSLITVGASGAVFGILLAFGMLFPNMPLYIMFIPIPVKAKWAVLGYGLLELFFGVTGSMDHVAHFAHLGGMLFAFIIIMYWKKKGVFDRYHEI